MKFLLLLGVAIAVQAKFPPDFTHNWTNLRVRWHAVPFKGVNELPRSLKEIGEFELRDDLCKTGGKFAGQRYWFKKDPALSLLFDKNGIIAGVQTSVPKTGYKKNDQNPYYIDDGEYWTLTSYFMDPSKICSEGRTQADLDKATAEGLWFQTASTIDSVYKVPQNEADMKDEAAKLEKEGKPHWGYGKCFWTMGQHYWYNIKKEMNCDADLAPKCLLYNGGKLTGFCFAINGDFTSPTKRYDWPKPKYNVIEKFMDPLPQCFDGNNKDYMIQSTMHFYFTDQPKLTSWC